MNGNICQKKKKIEEEKSGTCTRPDGADKSVATVDSDHYPIYCRLTDLYLSQSCWQHARNNTVSPEEELRVGLLNYALVLWIIVIKCNFFVNLVCIYLKWHQGMSVYSSWEHTLTQVCNISLPILRMHSWLFCITHWTFLLHCCTVRILVWHAAGSACS